jgi:cyclase
VKVTTSRHFTLHELDTGVHAAISNDGGWAICNAGIVDLGDHTIVFDTFVNQDAAKDLKDAAERISGKSVDYVINSHRHGDHVRGNQVFEGAHIVATQKTRDAMAELKKTSYSNTEVLREANEKELEKVLSAPEDPDAILQEGYIRGALEGLKTLNYTLPDVTFEASWKIQGGKREAEAISYGGGHTESDSLLYLPGERIAFLGDLLFVNYQPYLADGDRDQLLKILDKIEALDAKTLVPGHGPVGTPQDIVVMREYVAGLEKTVEKARASGEGFEQATEVLIDPRFSDWKWRNFYKDNLGFLFQYKSKPILETP